MIPAKKTERICIDARRNVIFGTRLLSKLNTKTDRNVNKIKKKSIVFLLSGNVIVIVVDRYDMVRIVVGFYASKY